MTLLYILAAYLIAVWVGVRLVVPGLGFRELAPPNVLPLELKTLVQRFDAEAVSDTEFARKCFEYVTETYQGGRLKTLTHFWKAFQNPLTQAPGYLPCTSQNYLLRALLLASGRFGRIEVQTRIVPLNFFIHQYLEVRADGKLLFMDPWSFALGIPFGGRARWYI